MQIFLACTDETIIKKIRELFILDCIFNKPILVAELEKVAMDYYIRMSIILSDFRAFGVNYNQTETAL